MLNVRLTPLFLLLGSLLLAKPALAQSDTARFLACFSGPVDDSLSHIVDRRRTVPHSLALKFIYSPLKHLLAQPARPGNSDNFDLHRQRLKEALLAVGTPLQDSCIYARGQISLPDRKRVLHITSHWEYYGANYSLLLQLGPNMELEAWLPVCAGFGDGGFYTLLRSWASPDLRFIHQEHTNYFALFSGNNLSELIGPSAKWYNNLPDRTAGWGIMQSQGLRCKPGNGFNQDSTWCRALNGRFNDLKTAEMLVLEDFGENGVLAGYKSKPSQAQWLGLEVLTYSREAHQLTVRFPGDKTTYTLRLNPSHTECESQGSDGSAVQVFRLHKEE